MICAADHMSQSNTERQKQIIGREMKQISLPSNSTIFYVHDSSSTAGFKCTVNLCNFKITFLGNQFLLVNYKTEVTLSSLQG